MTLPPLPEPVDWIYDPEDALHTIDTYTADQMRAYGEACAAAERARVLAWLDDALADHKIVWPGEIDILRGQIASGRAKGETPCPSTTPGTD